VGLSHEELMALMDRFEAFGLDELVLSVDGTRVELTSSGKPPLVDAETAADSVHEVLAPSVGTVRPVVAVGSEIGPEDVVCILEVWKSTIEVQAGVAGTVRELHVEEGTLAEYGQALLSIRPA
jgi:acetyl-CoA carboxylase biotin carboxyl carrier protein